VPRPKEFDRDVVLETAKAVFWRKGYEATSTEDLRLAMGIGRQSFYDTFGGKRQIYIEVLRRYNADSMHAYLATLRTAPSPLAALEDLLLSFSKEEPRRRALGCMGVAAICEFGVSDVEVARIGTSSSAYLESLLQQLLRDAKAKGQVRASLKERAGARHLMATILGLKVMSKGGARPEMLRDVAATALEGIAAPRSGRTARTKR
jgi:TetR/AcrR family transcriptional regulator, transcriptional repressor for nem operon